MPIVGPKHLKITTAGVSSQGHRKAMGRRSRKGVFDGHRACRPRLRYRAPRGPRTSGITRYSFQGSASGCRSVAPCCRVITSGGQRGRRPRNAARRVAFPVPSGRRDRSPMLMHRRHGRSCRGNGKSDPTYHGIMKVGTSLSGCRSRAYRTMAAGQRVAPVRSAVDRDGVVLRRQGDLQHLVIV